jgi:hypothetical protein
MNEEEKRQRWLEINHDLLEDFLTLVNQMSKIVRSDLSTKDSKNLKRAMKVGLKVTKAFGETVQAAPDADLYDQLYASTERLREETGKAIKIIDGIIAKQRPIE